MGAACSLDASYEDEENHQHPHHPAPDDAPHDKSRRVAAVHALSPQQRSVGASAGVKSYKADATLPRDVQLHRMWTSVVVGELVKNHAVSVYDETQTVLQVVQGMIRSGANYAIIRKIRQPDAQPAAVAAAAPAAGSVSTPAAGAPGSSAAAIAARSFRLTRRVKAEAESYVGLFDWRDLNSLLVSVCKSNRLHNTTHCNPAAAAPRPSAAAPGKQITEDEDTEEVLETESTAGSPAPLLRTLDPAPSTPTAAAAAGFLQVRTAATNSPAGGSKRAIQLTVTTAPQPAASSSSIIPASPQATSPPRTNDANGCVAPASDKSDAVSGSLGLDGDGPLASASPAGSSPTLSSYLHFLDMKRAPVRLVSNLSGRNPMQVVNTACPLLGGAQLLVGLIGAGHQHVAPPATSRRSKVGADSASAGAGSGAASRPELYRLTVTDKNGVCVGCMTQLALCGFVKDKLAAMGALADQSLLELGLGRHRRAMTVSWKSPVLTSMLLMHDRRLSALAIVNDSNGKLVGTISCSDVKYLFLAPELLLTLQRPVSVFIHMLRQSTSYWHVNLSSNPPPTAVSQSVTVTTKTSLRQTVDTLLSNKVRRAWIVNEQQQPIGMVSISDIVKFALPPQHTPTTQHH